MTADASRRLPANIALLGFMAAGKTSVGRALAVRLGWRFVDADETLVARAGLSIPAIFEREGEGGFRDRETAVLRDLARGARQVIACGGGAVLRPCNVALLARRCWRVLLWARPETLARRVLADSSARPVLGVSGPGADPEEVRARLDEVLAHREPLYRAAADAVFETDAATPEELADRIARRWRRTPQRNFPAAGDTKK